MPADRTFGGFVERPCGGAVFPATEDLDGIEAGGQVAGGFGDEDRTGRSSAAPEQAAVGVPSELAAPPVGPTSHPTRRSNRVARTAAVSRTNLGWALNLSESSACVKMANNS